MFISCFEKHRVSFLISIFLAIFGQQFLSCHSSPTEPFKEFVQGLHFNHAAPKAANKAM